MKKILALISVTSLVLNSSSAGIILLKNNIQSDTNNNLALDSEISDLLIQQNKFSQSVMSTGDIIDMILPFIKNKTLANDAIVNIINSLVRKLKTSNPDIVKYLSFTKFGSFLSLTMNEFANDWDQQENYGNNPLEAMKNFIASSKGDITHAKTAGNKGQWHYVEVRAKNWNWNDFYQYMAGANLNYMIKILSGGNYIGNLVNKYLDIGPWKYGFDKDGFLNEFVTSMQKLPNTKEAWPYLVKAVVPLLKAKVLKQENVINGFDNLTWEENNSNDLSLKSLLTAFKHLLSAEGRTELINLFASLLSGPFGEDIIINLGVLGYYTFPEILKVVNDPPISWIIGDKLKPEVLAEGIVDQLINITNDLGIIDVVENIIIKVEEGMTKNLIVNLKELSIDLNKLFLSNNFETGLDQILDIIDNPETSKYSLKEIFQIWGVQKGAEDFKIDSPFFILKKWIDDPNSLLNHILDILRNLDKTIA